MTLSRPTTFSGEMRVYSKPSAWRALSTTSFSAVDGEGEDAAAVVDDDAFDFEEGELVVIIYLYICWDLSLDLLSIFLNAERGVLWSGGEWDVLIAFLFLFLLFFMFFYVVGESLEAE